MTADCQLPAVNFHCDPCVFFAIPAVHNLLAGSCLNRYGRDGFRNGRHVFVYPLRVTRQRTRRHRVIQRAQPEESHIEARSWKKEIVNRVICRLVQSLAPSELIRMGILTQGFASLHPALLPHGALPLLYQMATTNFELRASLPARA